MSELQSHESMDPKIKDPDVSVKKLQSRISELEKERDQLRSVATVNQRRVQTLCNFMISTSIDITNISANLASIARNPDALQPTPPNNKVESKK